MEFNSGDRITAAKNVVAVLGQSLSDSGNIVYRAVSSEGETVYIGITNNLTRRAAEQLKSNGIEIEPIDGLENLTRADARSVEQVLIEANGLGKSGGTLINKINSIAQNNPIYGQSVARGQQLLEDAGQDATSLANEAASIAAEAP